MGNYFAKNASVLMIGAPFVGKTKMMVKLMEYYLPHQYPTIGFSIETYTYKKMSVTCWDLSGSMNHSMNTLWRHYLEVMEGLILVLDGSDPVSIEYSVRILAQVIPSYKGGKSNILILVNKSDLQNSLSLAEISELCRPLNISPLNIRFVSAKTGENIVDSFEAYHKQLTQ